MNEKIATEPDEAEDPDLTKIPDDEADNLPAPEEIPEEG